MNRGLPMETYDYPASREWAHLLSMINEGVIRDISIECSMLLVYNFASTEETFPLIEDFESDMKRKKFVTALIGNVQLQGGGHACVFLVNKSTNLIMSGIELSLVQVAVTKHLPKCVDPMWAHNLPKAYTLMLPENFKTSCFASYINPKRRKTMQEQLAEESHNIYDSATSSESESDDEPITMEALDNLLYELEHLNFRR
uniref:Uncharacterized protein n=1 Tax=Mucochytrium quahogii TaxID=96639 RepID=A0A7S2WB08_9STRA|mmetsp:Transcript_15444/g.25242  ORF Transcript_15444/g.25242 Transcript_15444/m.25242 type:complete len:200 (-) Transcript_15444:44-643(-)|eukprot:CAMPEP_0203784946 /NCGR_PEP_ID=MMETSP0100_2-20121128/751_1 /ASSEMBLY_ACC=CAM_ASM_000210 /TAXON_ID=96639 /ORGANISM=" , Strain NY0313808BC1" /LENGTH=199 /DNA_ID=CAMNT_0050686989 /DNA_START=356 /DNA_END=955 /DNA_ORIENTATION=+